MRKATITRKTAETEITVEIKRRYDTIVVEYNRGRCAL